MSSISAGLSNSTSIVVTGDNTGNLVLQTNGTTVAATFDTNQNATFANNVTVTGTINANISGNGASLTNINASNVTSGTLDNARTSAASANGASTIVARDSNGSFAGNVISGTSGSFTNISGNGATLTDINASSISSGTIANARTTAATANGASTIVLRGSTGEFTAGAITADSFTGNGAAISGINASNISSGTIDNARTTAASANGASTIVARDSNGSFTANAGTFTTLSGNLTGNVTLTTGTITTNAANATDITNKTYVDGLFSTGISYHDPVLVEEDVALNAVYVQPNGAGNGVGATLTNNGSNVALVVDGVSVSNTARILVYAQANAVQNGVYTVTNPGNASAQWVLTRATDADTFGLASPNKLGQGDAFFVTAGDTGAGRTYICNTSGTITFGSTNITFAQISSAQIYAAGTGLNLSNLTFSVANTAVTAATYGNDGAVPQIAVNAQGQITSASNVSINASSISVGTLANARTTADSANGASTIVARDSNGSFTANVVTAGTGSFTAVSGNGIALTAINASNIASGTLAVARGGTGASSLAGANIVVSNATTTFTALQTFTGTTATKAIQLLNGAETVNIVAAAPASTTNFDVNSGAVQYYTSNAANNWTLNIRFSSGTSLNTAMSVGDSITIALVTTQGGTAYYSTALTIDGGAVTPKYQGGTAWSSGKINGLDVYVYTIIKTASATYVALASQTQFK